jgi:hypothetical protein
MATRTPIGPSVNVSANNDGRKWGVVPGTQRGYASGSVIGSLPLLESAVAQITTKRALKIANSRTGAIFVCEAKYLNLLARAISQAPDSHVYTAFPPSKSRVLIKVAARSTGGKVDVTGSPESWMAIQVREARMHKTVYDRLGSRGPCMSVAPFYYSGVDPSNGLYYTVMMCPGGTVKSLHDLVAENKVTMQVYRVVEASIANVWRTGALIGDMASGDIICSSQGMASIVDFDSAIVIPRETETLLKNGIASLERSVRMDKCGVVRKSTEPEYSAVFELASRVPSQMRTIRTLVSTVYQRTTWHPDFEYLRFLWSRVVSKPGRSGRSGGGSSGSSGSGSDRLARAGGYLRKGARLMQRGLRSHATENTGITIRKIVSLSNENKSQWRERRHGKGWTHTPRHTERTRINRPSRPDSREVALEQERESSSSSSRPVATAPAEYAHTLLGSGQNGSHSGTALRSINNITNEISNVNYGLYGTSNNNSISGKKRKILVEETKGFLASNVGKKLYEEFTRTNNGHALLDWYLTEEIPVYGRTKNENVKKMTRMQLDRSSGKTKMEVVWAGIVQSAMNAALSSNPTLKINTGGRYATVVKNIQTQMNEKRGRKQPPKPQGYFAAFKSLIGL